MNRSKTVILAALFVSLFAFPVAGGDFDGTKPMLCVFVELTECTPDGGCTEMSLESMHLPRFIRIDFKKKSISGKLTDGTVRSVSIESKKQQRRNLVLQGVQNGRGWSAVIGENTGEMNLAVAGNGLGFFVSGACIIP